MAVGKEIRTKIGSIKNTQKITRAMEMVAASKMRKTKDRMLATRPYSKKLARLSSIWLKQILSISTLFSSSVRLSGLGSL